MGLYIHNATRDNKVMEIVEPSSSSSLSLSSFIMMIIIIRQEKKLIMCMFSLLDAEKTIASFFHFPYKLFQFYFPCSRNLEASLSFFFAILIG